MHHELGPAQGGRERPYLLVAHSHFHCPPRDWGCPAWGCGLPVVGVRPAGGGRLVAGTADRKQTRRSHAATPTRVRRKSMLETASVRVDGPVVGPGEAAVPVVAAAGEDSRADRRGEGRAQFGRTAQMMMVRLVQQKWGLGMYSHLHHHPRRPSLAAPPVRRVHDPDGSASAPRQQAGVGQRRRVGTRSNGDA